MDFGTSNSTFAVSRPGAAPQLLPLEDGRPTLPTALFFSFEDDAVYFGRRGVEQYVGGTDGRLLRAIKSVLGTALFADSTRVKRRRLGFDEIVGLFVGEMRRRAGAVLGTMPDRIVCGRPVRFVDDDDAADRRAESQLAAALAAEGFRHVEFQFEPIAAALDYEQQVAAEELALVADIGGGTSDFTVIRLSPERARAPDRAVDILATGGVHIGGTDLDRMLSLARIMPLLGYGTETADGKRPLPQAPYYDLATWHRINRLYNATTLAELRSTLREAAHPDLVANFIAIVEDRLGHRLAGRVEESKIALSAAGQVAFRFMADDVALAADITAEQLGLAIAGGLRGISGAIADTLERAGIGAERIDTLILTGGSTRLPQVAQLLRWALPAARPVETDAFGSVGLGLALDAARRFGYTS